MTLFNVLLVVGCIKHNRKLFLPWLIFFMLAIITCYLFSIILLVAGILTLVYSDKISGNLFLDSNGGLQSGDKYTIVGTLAGATAISAALIMVVLTSKNSLGHISFLSRVIYFLLQIDNTHYK